MRLETLTERPDRLQDAIGPGCEEAPTPQGLGLTRRAGHRQDHPQFTARESLF